MPDTIEFPTDKYHFRSEALFAGLPKPDQKFLDSKMVKNKFRKGTMLFNEGSYPSGIFYLIKGKVKKIKSDRDGREQIIYLCCSGELLGYPAVLSEEPFTDSASTLEDSEIAFIPKKDFMTLLDQSAVLSDRLLKNLSHKFGVLENIIAAFAHKNVRERFALSLLILMEKFKEKNKKTEIVLSREDLSNFVGTAVETLVRLIREFKEDGLIETEGKKIRLLNIKQLIKIANAY